MKTGRTLVNLAQELQRQLETKKDYLKQLAQNWNGGIYGHQMADTEEYADRVMNIYEAAQ